MADRTWRTRTGNRPIWTSLYFSFTNARAFQPTDVMPLRIWAKMTMMLQAALSLVLALLGGRSGRSTASADGQESPLHLSKSV